MSVWLAIPSKRPIEESGPVLKQWEERGYKIALYRDGGDLCLSPHFYIYSQNYPGYAAACNSLIKSILANDSEAEWFVTGGDDILPDPNHSAKEIAAQCSDYFGQLSGGGSTFGVMQPTGHRWGDKNGAYIDRVAGSPWLGRSWCERANQGGGPYWPEFTHMFVDECLREVAVKFGVYWERPDLVHFHRHWGLPASGETLGERTRMPQFLEQWNTIEHWNSSKAILDRLRAEGFKSCQPL